MAFNTTRLVKQVKIKGALPLGRFEDDEILDIAYDVLLSEIAPFLISLRQDYFVRKKVTTIVSGTDQYRFGNRAFGQTLREVKMLDGQVVRDLERIDLEEIRSTVQGKPHSFYVMGNSAYLYPTPNVGSLKLWLYYYLRPPKLVPVNECAQISAIDTGTNTVTVSAPSSWSTSESFDLIRHSDGFSLLDMDLSATAVSTTSITFASSLPDDLAVGDFVALGGESCFPYLPTEAHLLLIQKVVSVLLASMGDAPGSKIAEGRAGIIQAGLENTFATRLQGAPKQFSEPLF